ncbi:MAG: hypothetical protein WC236_00660 [Gallionellaceae bacterium]|jgi:hypothetical protein
MNIHSLSRSLALILFVAAYSSAGAADAPYVRITFPPDGAKLDALSQSRIDYVVNPGPRGSHTHLYVDNEEAAILRKLSGSHVLESLPPGAHSLCIKVVNKAHVPIGVEQCISVKVE